MSEPTMKQCEFCEGVGGSIYDVCPKCEGSGIAPYSLGECPEGKMFARLPYFTDTPLLVEVSFWTDLNGLLREKTVNLLKGTAKNRYLSDEELEGAEFYPPHNE